MRENESGWYAEIKIFIFKPANIFYTLRGLILSIVIASFSEAIQL
jgi:hypothetical protein